MPDQHAAATEHDLIATITEPLSKLPEDPLSLASVAFPVALRGYDRIAVDAYVQRTAELLAELQSARSPEAAVRRALERVGEEISGILQRAHETADEITARSRSEAEERLETARKEATAITADAELLVKDLDAETERIWVERHSIVTDARDLARRLTELAESALERFPAATSPEEVQSVSGGVSKASDDAEVPHLFDGAMEAPQALGSASAAEPPFERPTEDHLALDPPAEFHVPVDHPPETALDGLDQPTVGMPPIVPREDDPGSFGTDGR